MKAQLSLVLFIVLNIYLVAAYTNYQDSTITGDASVQRNDTIVAFFVTPPFTSSFYWNYTLQDSDGNTLNNSFCAANTTSIIPNLVYQNSTFQSSENYTRLAIFEFPNQTAIYLTDLTHRKIDVLVFTVPNQTASNNSTSNSTNGTNGTSGPPPPPPPPGGPNRLLDAAQNTSALGFANIISAEVPFDSTSNAFNYASMSQIQNHFLLNINNAQLLLAINGVVQIFTAVMNQLTLTTTATTNLTNCQAMTSYGRYAFAASASLQIYDTSKANASSLPVLKELFPSDFNNVNTLHIIDLAVDNHTQILYVMDFAHGIFLVDISQLPTIGSIVKLKTQLTLGDMMRFHVGGQGGLFVELDDGSGDGAIYELFPDNLDPQDAQYYLTRTHATLPGIKGLSADMNVGVTTIDNVINVFVAGIPSDITGTSTLGTDLSLSVINVQLASLFHIGNLTFVFAAGKSQFTVYQIIILPPFIICSPPSDAHKQTYLLNGTLWSTNCSLKANRSDTNPTSYCTTTTLINVDVWDSLLTSAKIGLAIGLSIGLFIAAVGIGCCIYYLVKARRYKKLLNDESFNRSRSPEIKAEKKTKSPKDAGNKYVVDNNPYRKRGTNESPVQDVEIPEQHLKYDVPHTNQFQMEEQNMDDVYKDD